MASFYTTANTASCLTDTGSGVTDSGTDWVNWNIVYDTSTTEWFSTNNVWISWNVSTTATSTNTVRDAAYWQIAPARRDTQQERAAQQRRDAQFREEQTRRESAEQKAEALLLLLLSLPQREEYQEKKQFHLYTKSGKKYLVARGRSGNVKLVNETDKPMASFCIHHEEAMPTADLLLHQKLLLETDEEAFLKTANRKDIAA